MKNILTTFLLVVVTLSTTAQQKTISGIVSDENNLPLPAATILIKGTTIGTSTDFDGNYSIKTNLGDTLVFTYVGYTTKTIIVGTNNEINVSLQLDSNLEEVVVTALGIRRERKALIYAAKVSGLEVTTHSLVEAKDLMLKNNKIGHSQLTAAEINDLKKWDEWLNVLENEQLKNMQSKWSFGLKDRIDVSVLDLKNEPINNALVILYDKELNKIMSIRTDVNGKAILFKDLFNRCVSDYFTIQISYEGKILGRRIVSENKITFQLENSENENKAIDIMFTIDATGSMSDEINYLKSELSNIIELIDNSIKQKRLALTVYRDFGDDFVTRNFDFTTDIYKVQNHLKNQYASGGGDYEEAVEQALKISLMQSWNEKATTKLLFLLLDAPPHFTEENVKIIKKQIKIAQSKGIKIIPIVASDANKDLEFLMRFFSISTNGTYVFLTDDSGIGNSHIKPTTKKFKVEKLNDLIVRLIKSYTAKP